MPSALLDDDVDALVAREYLRVSRDRHGNERSNEQQHDDHVRHVTRKGWSLADLPAYRDVGSAWGGRSNRKRRDDFDRLVADVTAGTFGADVLLIWESSRGSRDVEEWAAFLKLCRRKALLIYVTSHRQLYDPRVSRHWRSLIEDAVDSEFESMKNSDRTGRDMAASAELGARHGGRRAFGYSADGTEHVAEEAAAIRDCAQRVLAGQSMRSLAADLNRRGIRTPGTKANPAGNEWHPGALKAVLVGPRIAGLRTHRGRVVAKGQWPEIIDEATHRRLVAVLSPTGTRTSERGQSPWPLSGFLRCGRERCGATLVGWNDAGTRRYTCRKGPGFKGCGGLGIKAEPLEELLGIMVSDRLRDETARAAAELGPDDALEMAELDRIAAARLDVAEAGATLSLAARAAEYAALDRRQADAERRLAAKVRQSAPLDLIAAEESMGRPWDELAVEEQRVRLRAMIDHVTVAPASRRGSRQFEPARVTAGKRIAWRV